ncbi:MAG TPA: hypothetical protein VIX84_18925, partial [Acidimicrobiales bacterium]
AMGETQLCCSPGRDGAGHPDLVTFPGPGESIGAGDGLLKPKRSDMKTMTCKQMGGPCDVAHHGTTADEVIKAQDGHLKQMVGGGDGDHQPALKEMKGRWRHPISGMGWYRQTKRDFAALPED